MFSKLKQFQDLRSQANKIKEELSKETVEGSGAWGKVKIIIDGNQEIKKVEIDPELMSDKTRLESAIEDAANDAIKKVQRVMAQKMSQMGGMDFPGLS